jgi:hypothetical protein
MQTHPTLALCLAPAPAPVIALSLIPAPATHHLQTTTTETVQYFTQLNLILTKHPFNLLPHPPLVTVPPSPLNPSCVIGCG